MEGGAPGMDNKKELFKGDNWELPTDIDLVEPAEGAFARKLIKADWPESDIFDFQLAFHEALANAIAHGNLGITKPEGSNEDIGEIAKREQVAHPTKKKIYISIDMKGKKVTVKIRDEGNGFKLKAVGDPTDSSHLFKTEGRGILFMRAYVDSVVYNKKGNEVTMMKERKE